MCGRVNFGHPMSGKRARVEIERLNPILNAFITRLDRAGESELDEIPGSELRETPLAGAPVAIKDLFETKGTRTTAGSLFFKDYVPSTDSAAVKRVRSAGGRVIGKTNTHEIALGVTTVNPHFGACRNPWNIERVSGGSSGGSAVAVCTGMALAALGTDTGGSIRIPASLCGVVGLKPTFGRVSLRGVIPLSWNLDHVGPLTRTVADAALMLEVLSGPDDDDPTSVESPIPTAGRSLEAGILNWRMAMATGAYVEDCDPEVLESVETAAAVFRQLGADVERRELSYLSEAAQANAVMTQADAAAFHRERLAQQPMLFGEDVRQRLETGRAFTATEYVLARRTQTEIRHRLMLLLREYDALLLPTTPVTAPSIEGGDAIAHARQLTRFTAPFNLAGLPAISIPCGFSRDGMPIGLQLVGAAWNEARLLQAARSYERQTGWGSRTAACALSVPIIYPFWPALATITSGDKSPDAPAIHTRD